MSLSNEKGLNFFINFVPYLQLDIIEVFKTLNNFNYEFCVIQLRR